MKRLITALFIVIAGTTYLFGQSGELTGTVKDENGDGIPFANVIAEQGGGLISGTTTDFDGNYTIKPLAPGKYDIKISYIGYAEQLNQGVVVNADKITTLDVSLKSSDQVIGMVDVIEYKVPLIDKENNSTKTTISKEQIAVLPTRSVTSIASTSAGVYQEDEGGALSIKGGRDDATEYYIDGIRVRGSSNIPANAIEQLTVITGGVPSKYGNSTGGVITITTKGPSRKLGGGAEVLTSQYLDDFGYNLFNVNLTGPIYKKNKGTENEKTIFGFFVAAEYKRQKDIKPSAIGVYRVKEDVLKDLQEYPLVADENSDAFIVKAETLTANDLEKVDAKLNVVDNNASMTLKFDVKPSENFIIQFGGTANYRQYHDWIQRYSLMNWENNPLRKDLTWRVFARFTQKLGRQGASGVDGDDTKRSAFQNAFYTIQIDYTKQDNKIEDESIGIDPFLYGYVGAFDTKRQPIYSFGNVEHGQQTFTGWELVGYQDTLVTFTPGAANPTTANYAETYYQLAGGEFIDGTWTASTPGGQEGFYETLDQIRANNGVANGDRPRIAHSTWFNVGRQYNGYSFTNNDQFRISVNGSVDIIPPGGNARNKHAIEFGFEFEQRIDRRYSIQPIGLWTLMRQHVNKHILELDTENPYLLIDGQMYSPDDPNRPNFGVNDSIFYNRRVNSDEQSIFDRNLRTKIGATADEFINLDNVDPSSLSLDMFSADELLNEGNSYVYYRGYDYTGNKLKGQVSFEDYFKEKDADGNNTRPVDAFRPIYSAFYIQDKFNFKDVLFNIGVRIDRFDANQKVLKDKYSLYDVYSVGEARSRLDQGVSIPGNIDDDYVVYVDDFSKDAPTPVGYRDGDVWYSVDGEVVIDPSLIEKASSSGRITPFLVDENVNIQDDDFDVNSSFEDYKPQITVMPRLAFSFNLTDEASFFAHYDVLTQRPPSRNNATPEQWYFFESNIGGAINNPDLKPERTVDYQLGFKQLVSRNSAITISAFYREMKDMIQVRNIAFAYPRNYLTFDNIDFGTVKGLSISFDLRKTSTSNFSMQLAYTIQFAEGTGSDDASQGSLVQAGQPNLRSIAPLNIDSRHNFNITADYSYGSGKNYNGPVWGGKNVFASSGVNLIIRGRSGEPFTAQSNATPEALTSVPTRPVLQGGINASRLPWNFKIDFQIHKNFNLTGKAKTTKDGVAKKQKRPLNLDVYLQIQNLLNTKNIISVYSYTGNPDDDGYLSSAVGEQNVNNQVNAESFTDLYRAYIQNPNNYSLPRQIRLGLRFGF